MDEYNQYELHHKSRLAAKPGLTGMWQVSGRSDFTDFEEIVKMDSDYIKNWNIGLDIKNGPSRIAERKQKILSQSGLALRQP